MSAIPKTFQQTTARLSEEATRPYPNSRKVYIAGSRPDIRVGMREVDQTPTPLTHGEEANPPITIYDTSGPFTDPGASIDLLKGLAALRAPWILERGDSEELAGPSSDYGQTRASDPKLATIKSELAKLLPTENAVPGKKSEAEANAKQRAKAKKKNL